MNLEQLSFKERLLLGRRAEDRCARQFRELAERIEPSEETLSSLLLRHAVEEEQHEAAIARLDEAVECPAVWHVDEREVNRLLREHVSSLSWERPWDTTIRRDALVRIVRSIEQEMTRFYRSLAASEPDPESRDFFQQMADSEASHVEDLDRVT